MSKVTEDERKRAENLIWTAAGSYDFSLNGCLERAINWFRATPEEKAARKEAAAERKAERRAAKAQKGGADK